LLKRKHEAVTQSMMHMGLWFAAICLVLQLISGDSSARLIARFQPAKLAAFEGIYKTEPHTPISVVGWVDGRNQEVHSIKIPGALSWLTYRNTNTPVTGLDQIPRDEWPNVPAVFQTYHLMVAMWALMALIAALGLWFWKRKTLPHKKWLLWAMIFSVGFPHIAQQAGWMSTEMGRQPWIVWHQLRTADGVSTSIHSGQVMASIIMFIVIYITLFALFLFLLDRKIKHGPESMDTPEDVYRYPSQVIE
jgi:cytochrome d ubiquinol oxidase subunit I